MKITLRPPKLRMFTSFRLTHDSHAYDIESSYTLSFDSGVGGAFCSLRVEKFVAYNINNILLAI